MKYQQFDGVEEPEHDSSPSILPFVLCFITLLLVLLAFLLFFLVGVPALIQNNVDAAVFTIESVNMSQPDTKSIVLAAEIQVSPNPTFSFSILDATWSISFDKKEFGTILVPGFELSTTVSPNVVRFSSTLDVTDQASFDAMGAALIHEKTFSLGFYGEFKAAWLGHTFSRTIYFSKDVEVKGLNNLFRSRMTLNFTSSTVDSMNLVSVVSFSNPSVFQIDPLGILNFDVLTHDGVALTSVSSTEAVKLTLGDNKFTVSGKFAPTDANATGVLLGQYFSNADVKVIMQGVSSSLSLFQGVTTSSKFTPNLVGAPQLFQVLRFIDLDIVPLTNTSLRVAKSSFRSSFYDVTGPSSIFNINRVAMNDLHLSSTAGTSFGVIARLPSATVNTPSVDPRSWTYGSAPMNIEESSELALFVGKVLLGSNAEILLTGSVDLDVTFPFGNIVIQKVLLNKYFTNVPGLQMKLTNLNFGADTSDKVAIKTTTIGSTKPQFFGINLGDVSFEMKYRSQKMGLNIVPIALQVNGPLSLAGRMVQTEFQPTVFGSLLDDQFDGKVKKLQLQGVQSTFRHTWVENVLQLLVFTVDLENNKRTVIGGLNHTSDSMKYHISKDTTLSTTLTIPHGLRLPFSFNVTRVKLASALKSGGASFGSYNFDFTQSTNTAQVITVNVPDTAIVPVDNSLFRTVSTQILTTAQAPATLDGKADFIIKTAVGDVPLRNYALVYPFNLGAVQGFRKTPPLLSSFVFSAVSTNKIDCTLVLNTTNPSSTSFDFGTFKFDTVFTGQPFGSSSVSFNNYRRSGSNAAPGTISLTLPSSTTNDFISRVLGGSQPQLNLKGVPSGTAISLLQTGFSQINLPVTVTAGALIQDALIFVSYNDVLAGKNLPVTLSLKNPHAIPVSLIGGLTLKTTDPTPIIIGQTNVNLVVPAKTTSTASTFLILQRGTTFGYLSSLFGKPVKITFEGGVEIKLATLSLNPVQFTSPVMTTFLANKKRIQE